MVTWVEYTFESRGRLGQRGEEIDRVTSLSQVAHSRGVRVCERSSCPVTYPGQGSLS